MLDRAVVLNIFDEFRGHIKFSFFLSLYWSTVLPLIWVLCVFLVIHLSDVKSSTFVHWGSPFPHGQAIILSACISFCSPWLNHKRTISMRGFRSLELSYAHCIATCNAVVFEMFEHLFFVAKCLAQFSCMQQFDQAWQLSSSCAYIFHITPLREFSNSKVYIDLILALSAESKLLQGQ